MDEAHGRHRHLTETEGVDRWQQEREIAAAASGGLVRAADLRALGLTRDEQRDSVRGMERIRRGSYLHEPPGDAEQAHLAILRAVLTDRPWALASHTSAALLHGLPLGIGDLGVPHVSQSSGPGRGGQRFGVHTHYRGIPERKVVEVGGLRASCVTTTVIDCARLLALPAGLAIADAALHGALTTRAQLAAELRAFRRTRGVATARRVVDLADPLAESPGESRSRLILVEAGFRVVSQFVVNDQNGEFVARSDFLIEGTPVLVEFDGRAKFAINGDVEAAHWSAKLRRDHLQELGYEVFVVVWADLARPDLVIQRLERVLRRIGIDPWALRSA